jgi:hypothetical protein
MADGGGAHEPVWLVRALLALFLVAFAVFLAHEARQMWKAAAAVLVPGLA